MGTRSLKQARQISLLVPAGFLAMVGLLFVTHNWMVALPGVLVALVGFTVSSNAARCPKCSRSFFESGGGVEAMTNMVRLNGGASMACSSCHYRVVTNDYR